MTGRRFKSHNRATTSRAVRSYAAGHEKGVDLYHFPDQLSAKQVRVLVYEVVIPSTFDHAEYRKGMEAGYCETALANNWDVKSGNQVTTDEMTEAWKEFNKIFKTEQSALWGSTIDMHKIHTSEEEWKEDAISKGQSTSRGFEYDCPACQDQGCFRCQTVQQLYDL